MKYWEVLTLKVIKNFKRWYQDAKFISLIQEGGVLVNVTQPALMMKFMRLCQPDRDDTAFKGICHL